jgi:hypothetical protein
MRISKTVVYFAALIASLLLAAKERDWKQGTLKSVDATANHRYECVISDGVLLYTLEYEHPLKTAAHKPVKFLIEKDSLILLDSDGLERAAPIEKRERVLLDPTKPNSPRR